MGYVSYELDGVEYQLLEADVLDIQQFFDCTYEDALYHAALVERSLED